MLITTFGLLTNVEGTTSSKKSPAPYLSLRSNLKIVDTLKKDPTTGLAVDDHLPLVKAHCTACHSSKLILQNRFTRDGWKQKIQWMQQTQNLWDLGEAEPAVLDYLVKHYGPKPATFNGRRKPLGPIQWHKK